MSRRNRLVSVGLWFRKITTGMLMFPYAMTIKRQVYCPKTKKDHHLRVTIESEGVIVRQEWERLFDNMPHPCGCDRATTTDSWNTDSLDSIANCLDNSLRRAAAMLRNNEHEGDSIDAQRLEYVRQLMKTRPLADLVAQKQADLRRVRDSVSSDREEVPQ